MSNSIAVAPPGPAALTLPGRARRREGAGTNRVGRDGRAVGPSLWFWSMVRGTEEMITPCIIHLHVISLEALQLGPRTTSGPPERQ